MVSATRVHPRDVPPWWARSSTKPFLTSKQVRRRTPRGIVGSCVFVLVFLLGMYWVLTATEVKDVQRTDFGAFAYKQTTDALIGGCGPMYRYPAAEVSASSGTVPRRDKMGVTNRQDYVTAVPMFGRFWTSPAPEEDPFWERDDTNIPTPEMLLANMWRGAMVVYYSADVTDAELRTLREVLRLHPELDILVVPWDETSLGLLPQNREVAFATWNASQSCHQFIAPAAYDFRRIFPARKAPGFDGTAPPVISSTPPIRVSD